jgi:hypothetical protein
MDNSRFRKLEAPSGRTTMVNRTQALVLGFFVLAWASLLVILLAAPGVYDGAIKLPSGSRPAELGFLGAISAFIALLSVGVLRRWRWIFWLIVVAFLFGLLRVPASVLGLAGVLPAAGPTWYVIFQALVGLIQFAIGSLMVTGYRRAGTWGAYSVSRRDGSTAASAGKRGGASWPRRATR